MEIEWDEAKRRHNLDKHGVDFAHALEFAWEDALVIVDDRFAYGEERRIALGLFRGRVHVVVHTVRENVTRMISFRRANARERRTYEKNEGKVSRYRQWRS